MTFQKNAEKEGFAASKNWDGDCAGIFKKYGVKKYFLQLRSNLDSMNKCVENLPKFRGVIFSLSKVDSLLRFMLASIHVAL